MPHLIRGRKVKKSEKKRTIHGVQDAKTVNRRRRRLKALDFDLYKWIRLFSYAAVALMAVFTLAAVLAFNHWRLYPGRVERDSMSSPGRGSDYIVLSWDETQNTDVYRVWCREYDADAEALDPDELDAESDASEEAEALDDGSWILLETDVPEITVEGLNEDTVYSFIVRADNENREGIATKPRNFRTKKAQSVEVEARTITKFTFSQPFMLDATAETDLMYDSADPDVAEVDPGTGEVQIKGAGDTEITVRARSSTEYESAQAVVELKVIDSTPVSAGGASAHVIYHLDSGNCEVVKKVTGANGAVVPQGLGYSGDKYIISYGMGNPNRIISFDVDGDGKSVSVPKVSMGHPNGFCYADENGLCYCVKGWTSKAYTYESATDSYGSVDLSYGCSGIAYDRREKLLYTCSRTAMVAYDIGSGYSVKYKCGVVKHSGTVYTQDCGGHAGLLFRCLSGSSKHGTNYIDIYDMKNGRYLGTLSCDLSEVESCIVDDEGFLEILANNSSGTDYIWKTDLNVDTLGEGL